MTTEYGGPSLSFLLGQPFFMLTTSIMYHVPHIICDIIYQDFRDDVWLMKGESISGKKIILFYVLFDRRPGLGHMVNRIGKKKIYVIFLNIQISFLK